MSGSERTVKPPMIVVEALSVGDDPSIVIYHVTLEQPPGDPNEGIFTETLGSRELLNAFLRGCQAMGTMLGHHIPDPEIPQNPVEEEDEEEG